MKTLFLDIDGVLNIFSPSYNTLNVEFKVFHGDTYLPKMEQHLVRRLEYVIEQAEVDTIYITSSWGVKEAVKEFKRLKFKYINKIYPISLHNAMINRAKIIFDFVKNSQDIKSFVIFEDEPVGWESYPFVYSKTVTIDFKEGLTHKNCLDAIRILEGEII